MAKRKGTKKGKESNKLESAGKRVADAINAIRSQRSKRIFGIVLLVSGLLVSIAYLSYLSSWRHDQSLLVGDFSAFFMDKTVKVNNLLGKLGAWIAHLSFFKGFGLTSFVFPFLSIFFGLRLLIGRYPLPFWKTLSISAFVLVWGALSLGYFFPSLVHLGGSVGYESRLWAVSTLGSIGTVAMIGLFMVSFIILTFNPQFQWVTSLMENISFGNDEEETVVVAANLTSDEDDSFEDLDLEEVEPELEESSTVVEKSTHVVSTLSEKDLQIEEDILDSILSDDSDDIEEFEPVAPVAKANESIGSDDSDLQIEKTEEEVVLSEDELNQKVKEFGEYDPTLDLSSFQLPGIVSPRGTS